jgi:hypothetical protein
MSSLVCNLTSFNDQRNLAPVKCLKYRGAILDNEIISAKLFEIGANLRRSNQLKAHCRKFGQLKLAIHNPLIYLKNLTVEFSTVRFA